MSKRKVFISFNHKDKAKFNLLQGQLAHNKDILLSHYEPASSMPDINDNSFHPNHFKKIIEESIYSSSMMLVMIGEKWSEWQEYELNTATEKGVPVVGILSNKENKIESPIWTTNNIPIVNWNWEEISKILSGEVHSLDYNAPDKTQLESPIIQVDFSKISEELTNYLLSNPDSMHNMSPRKFEELVAYIMEKHGYEVTLTQQSRDGGIDIFALKNDGFGNILTIVDCKKYSEHNPVRIAAVRGMYGTLKINSASHGIIATTSRFTRDARNLAHDYKYQISLKDHADIFNWIQRTKI